jgi:hypothetical protein
MRSPSLSLKSLILHGLSRASDLVTTFYTYPEPTPLWLINAFTVVLLTLLGAAGEALGYDRHLKSNTTRRRTHSLLRQGSMLHELIPNMTEFRLRPLIERFAEMLATQPLFAQMFGAV